MSDTRVASTDQMSDIARSCDIHQYSERIDPALLDRLQPDGYHVLVVIKRYHDDGRNTVEHHRVRALLKVRDTVDPVLITLDVSTRSWDNLPTATDALRARELLRDLNR
jgi:hypothetical protein